MVLIAGKLKLAVKELFWKNVDKYFDIQLSFQWDKYLYNSKIKC